MCSSLIDLPVHGGCDVINYHYRFEAKDLLGNCDFNLAYDAPNEVTNYPNYVIKVCNLNNPYKFGYYPCT